jgi:hypothetical protein
MEIKLILLKCQVLTDVLAFARATMLVHVKGLKQPGKKIRMYVAQTLQPIFLKKLCSLSQINYLNFACIYILKYI